MGDYLTLKEVDQLINNVPMVHNIGEKSGLSPAQIQLFFKIMYHGMLRAEEASNLKKQDFNFGQKQIILRETQTGWRMCPCHGTEQKCPQCNGRGRYRSPETVMFSSNKIWSEIQHALRNLESDDYVFKNKRFMQPITRVASHRWIKDLTTISKINKNVNLKMLRNSRAQHLRLTNVLHESQIHQMYRGNKNQFSATYIPADNEKLIQLDGKANEYLKTYCEDCDFKNPDVAIFCCKCGSALTENKSIILS